MLHLKLAADPRWVDVAAMNIEDILIDHALSSSFVEAWILFKRKRTAGKLFFLLIGASVL